MYHHLKLSQMKQVFQKCVQLKEIPYPSVGWVRTMRELYGMSTFSLAKRIGIVQSLVSKVESRETEDRVTLATLRKFAHALNCDLVYVFVPREDPEQFLTRNAKKKAKKMVKALQNTMALEDQAVSEALLLQHETQLTHEFLNDRKKIWEDS